MKMHVFSVWQQRLEEDEIFVEQDEGDCFVDQSNLVEFIEALDV